MFNLSIGNSIGLEGHPNSRASSTSLRKSDKSDTRASFDGHDLIDEDDDGELDVDENWSGTVWQYTVLTPFADQLKSIHTTNKT